MHALLSTCEPVVLLGERWGLVAGVRSVRCLCGGRGVGTLPPLLLDCREESSFTLLHVASLGSAVLPAKVTALVSHELKTLNV